MVASKVPACEATKVKNCWLLSLTDEVSVRDCAGVVVVGEPPLSLLPPPPPAASAAPPPASTTPPTISSPLPPFFFGGSTAPAVAGADARDSSRAFSNSSITRGGN